MIDRFGLSNGDLVPKNVIVDKDGIPVVIDWGSASVGAVPFTDYKRIWRDEANEGFGPEDLAAFAEGYGIPVEDLLPVMEKMSLLDSIDVIRWAIAHRPDRLDHYVRRGQEAVALARRRYVAMREPPG